MFYVYLHIDPNYGYVTYVGKGSGGRAWDVSRNRNENPEHLEWMHKLQSEGCIPSDWVKIIYRGLSEKEAFSKEKEYLHTHGNTKFNRTSGQRNPQAKLTDDQAREIYRRSKTETHSSLASEYGVSRSAVSMIASRIQWKTATAMEI